MEMNRKEFLKTLGVTGTAFAISGCRPSINRDSGTLDVSTQSEKKEGSVDLVAVVGGEPDVLFRKAIDELGGMGRFVQKGQKVAIKPNMAWDRAPEFGANTNPILVAEMVKQALAAGASQVVVFDNTCDDMQRSYKTSGIERAALDAGAKVLPGNDERYYREAELPQGVELKSTKIHEALFDCDVWFNVPVLKHHRGAQMTIAMKNYMGIVWDRRIFHSTDLQQCIADVCTWPKKPVLNVVDAYRIMKQNGPQGKSEADAVVAKALIASTDIVAVDTASTKLAEQFTNIPLEKVEHITAGEQLKLGTTNIDSLNVRRVKV